VEHDRRETWMPLQGAKNNAMPVRPSELIAIAEEEDNLDPLNKH